MIGKRVIGGGVGVTARSRGASIGDINDILCLTAGPRNPVNGAATVSVGGVNPSSVTCRDITISGGGVDLTDGAFVHTPLVVNGGTPSATGISFNVGGADTGFACDRETEFRAVCGGEDIAVFSRRGLGVRAITAPDGTIDFGGAVFMNYSTASTDQDKWSYTLTQSAEVITVGQPDGDTVILTIPIAPLTASNAVTLIAECTVSAFAIARNSDMDSATYLPAVYTLTLAITLAPGLGDEPTVQLTYDRALTGAAGFSTGHVSTRTARGCAELITSGISGATVSWRARACIMRNEIAADTSAKLVYVPTLMSADK